MAENNYDDRFEFYSVEQFKTSLMGGYDKEDVQNQFNALKNEMRAMKGKFTAELEEKDKVIAEKDRLISEKNEEIAKLKKDISEKYQNYIDNYDTIGKIVYETRIESERLLKEAEEKSEKTVSKAEEEAKLKVEKAKDEIERVISEGKSRYAAIQEEINELITVVNQVQHKFMKSFKEIHELSDSVVGDHHLDMDDSYDEDEEF